MFFVPMSRETRPYPHHLSRLLDDTIERFLSPTAAAAADVAARSPALDVAENDGAYTVKLEMPGVSKEDVKVSVEGRQVTVQAQSQPTEANNESERLIHRERSAVSYARTFTLPLEVDQAQANATLTHGVLTLTLPKRGVHGAAQVTVN